jgi:ABC-type transport system involved in multi-copper enzyme maturation permease subunit
VNKIQAAQILGMTRYEFRMHWRRRGLLILMWGILVVVGISLLVSGDSFSQLSSLGADPALVREVMTAALILTVFSPIGVGLVFLLPLVEAETIPLDRQYGVRELLDTLPLSPNSYFIGKLLGMWAAVLSAMGLIMVVIGVIWWFKAGAFNVGDYIEVWLFGIGAIVVLNGSLGVLIPAAQASRRRAIIVTIVGMAVLAWLFGGGADNTDLQGMLNIIRWPILNYYLFSKTQVLNAVPSTVAVPSFETVLLTIGVGLIQLVLLFALVRLWTAWLESRQ